MRRKIIKINEEKCNGCGLCTNGCPEGAIQVISGKAKLVSETYCDGLGACIGTCPEGAITIEEREAGIYNESKVMENIVKAGEKAVKDHINHLKEHQQENYLKEALGYLDKNKINMVSDLGQPPKHSGCPGSKIIELNKKSVNNTGASELRQWPIQLHLLNPLAPYFKNADLVIAADCVPFAYPYFHERFLKDKILIIFCPKLDSRTDIYEEKLIEIFKVQDIKSVTMVHMQVPCCFGLVSLTESAISKSGKNIILKDYTISIDGNII